MITTTNFVKMILLLSLLIGLVHVVQADYSLKVTVKFPFMALHFDSLGNAVEDSLCRGRNIKAIIYRTGLIDSLSQEKITDSIGEAIFTFDLWYDGTPVDTNDIVRIDLDFTTTEEVFGIGDEMQFEPLRFEDMNLTRGFQKIVIVLPMTIVVNYVTVGAGPYYYDFAIMPDMHIGRGAPNNDFGSYGYDDEDDDPNETYPSIQNNEAVIAKITELMLNYFRPIKFVLCLGDVSHSAEHSEFQRANYVLQELPEYSLPFTTWLDRLFYVPIFGNHDTWPYVDGSEMPSNWVIIGGYFYGSLISQLGFSSQYESLAYFLPVPNWKESSLLSQCTYTTGQSYPSHYFNFSFDYQGRRFICTDWNTRCEADFGNGTSGFATVDKGQPWDYSWHWLKDEVSIAKSNKQKIAVLAHHPLRWYQNACFSSAEINEIADAGLRNVKPTPIWFGGHMHDLCYEYRLASNGDTIVYVYSVEDAQDGEVTIVRVSDSVQVNMDILPYTSPLPVTVNFEKDYDYQGSYNAPYSYNWNFGDGGSSYQQNPTHIYHFNNNIDTLFKVTLSVTTQAGRKVSYSKVIPVMASPYDFHADYIHEDGVMVDWSFDYSGYGLYNYIVRRGATDFNVPPSQTYLIDNAVTHGQSYTYKVSAIINGIESPWTDILAVDIPWLDAPTLQPVTEIPPNQVRVSWHNNSNYAINYAIARWDDIINNWNDTYHQNTGGPTDTLFTDNVEFLHKYKYRVLAKDNLAHSSIWSNVIEYTSGMLAQSSYPKMSAFNNGVKSKAYGTNIHVTYSEGTESERQICYLKSTDNGTYFTRETITGYGTYSNPAIALVNNIPYIVYGSLRLVTLLGPSEPGWHLCYTVAWKTGTSWYTEDIFDTWLSEAGNQPDEDFYLVPPSFTVTADSGYVAFKYYGVDIQVVGFKLSDPAYYQPAASIANTSDVSKYVSIGYDPAGRIVVLVHEWVGGPLTLYYRAIGPGNWSSLEVLPWFSTTGDGAYGSPSFWTGLNELQLSIEGCYNAGQAGHIWGLLFRRLLWPVGVSNYSLGPIELVSQNTDFSDDCLEGYGFLASKGLVLWKYDDIDNIDDDEIFYSQKRANQWTAPENISGTSDAGEISSYPQGIVIGGLTRPRLLALWTEKVGSSYYLVRQIRNLPSVYQNITQITETPTPEATAYNNARRMLKDNQGALHFAFTGGDNVYHTYHNANDTIWSEPAFLGEGKYPALALAADGKLYCSWCYHGYQEFDGAPYFVEYLRMRSFNGVSWSKPTKLLFHTYGTYLWGVGAPSLAVNDTMAYVTFKSYHGPTFNPTPGEPYPHIVVVEGPALIYGTFPLNNPDAFAYQIIDTIIKTPNPVDTLTYRDSLVPLLISPSIAVDIAGIPHILWEGDSTTMRYYTVTDTVISRQIFDSVPGIRVDFPSLIANNDQVQLLWTANDSIKYRYGWSNTELLSQPITIAACESPVTSGPYLAWTKQSATQYGGLSHLYYGAIPASGAVDPVEINYSTDLINYPQILFNPEKQNQTSSLDLIWTEYSQTDSLGYIYYLNLPLTEEIPVYSFDMGTEIPVPILIQRDGFLAYGSEDYKTVDYDSTELIYHLTLHSPHKKYRIKWTYYHQEPDKIKLDFSIDDIMHHNHWVEPYEQVTQETWIPDSCLADNEITIKITKLSGSLAILSGFEIYERLVGGGGPQGSEVMISRPFFLDRIYPNPAKGMIRIRFNSPDERQVSIKLYDVTGRLVLKLLGGKAHAGMNEVAIMTGELANGIYFMKLDADEYSKVEKLILLK